MYKIITYNSDVPSDIGYDDNVAGNWYIRSFGVDNMNYRMFLKNDTHISKSNIEKLLTSKNEKSTDIKVIFTNMGGGICTQCAVIFVDDTAKYVYYYTFLIPYQNMREDTPEEIRKMAERQASKIFANFSAPDSTDIKELYSYNMIIYFMRLCEEYS